MVAGLAPRELAPFIAGAPLMALVKAGGGLRPIAIGETVRRLVSKCCCEASNLTPPLSAIKSRSSSHSGASQAQDLRFESAQHLVHVLDTANDGAIVQVPDAQV